MKKTNALKLRQSLGAVLKELSKSGEPILIEKDRKPAAVLISLADYQQRFADLDGDLERQKIVEGILSMKFKLPAGKTSLDLIESGRK